MEVETAATHRAEQEKGTCTCVYMYNITCVYVQVYQLVNTHVHVVL